MPPAPKQSNPPAFDGSKRVVIENLSPEIDCGRFPLKRVLGEQVLVEADIFADGHDLLKAALTYRHESENTWSELKMAALVNDRWRASFEVHQLGTYFYTIRAWVDHFGSWRRTLEKKYAAGQDVAVELLLGANFLQGALKEADDTDRVRLERALSSLSSEHAIARKVELMLSPEIAKAVETWHVRPGLSEYNHLLRVTVDPPLAGFSAWYELFPRSCSPVAGKHGTFADCEALLPRIIELGFDVLYLPPIHPIGLSFRKGRNNALQPEPQAPGSPWAIGGPEGGHKAVHPELGTLEDFRRLVSKARELKVEIALDIAFQCSPDHPYVREHPDWFRHRPDGSIQYAENPPKKYQDIFPLNFENPDWWNLWNELKSIFEFWAQQGVRIFRVDNPHTKPLPFWQWCIGELKQASPDLIFLSEAFTRPKVMYGLAKVGFSQSYNYFPWRNTKHELTTYFVELTTSGVHEFFRPNLWPNTPDILTQYLQFGGKPAFLARLLLAATLGSNYGIYGLPFEFCENKPREPGSEEYLDSEKYELRYWNLKEPSSLSGIICRLNRLRRENKALQTNLTLRFHEVDNDQLIAYSKHSRDLQNIVLIVVNLDPRHIHRGWVNLDLSSWGLSPTDTYQVHELLTDAHYLWSGPRNFVELNPSFVPGHIFRIRKYVRTEQDFDYFL